MERKLERDKQKKGILGRAVGRIGAYTSNRLMARTTREVAIDTARVGSRAALEAIRPARISAQELRAGLNGRYEDGGLARFSEALREAGVDERDLPRMAEGHRRASLVYIAGAVGLLLLSCHFALAPGLMMKLSSVATLVATFAIAAFAMRHDFIAWQIDSRAFAGFRKYLDYRLS